MDIRPANIAFFFTSLRTDFWKAYDLAKAWATQFATTVPSDTDQEGYGWIGMLDKVREWTGARVVNTAAPQTYFVQNQLFEVTQGIDKIRLKNDKYGIYLPVPSFMGLQVKKWPDYQLRDLIENLGSQATTARQTGTDGLSHWNSAHPIDFYDAGKGTYSNDLGAAGSSIGGITVGGALAPTAYATARQEFMNRKAENGEKLGLMPRCLMVPSQLDITGKTILQASFFAPQTFTGTPGTNVGATENMLKGSADLDTNVDLTSSAAWYLFDLDRPLKPFIWQLRESPLWVQRISEQDPVVFDTHQYLFGVEMQGAPAWGFPWLSMRSGV